MQLFKIFSSLLRKKGVKSVKGSFLPAFRITTNFVHLQALGVLCSTNLMKAFRMIFSLE